MKKVNCPSCNKLVTWDIKSTFKPFCSQRCKMIDFGNWANENYYVVSETENATESLPYHRAIS